jgi:DNA-binding NtrC family response regulator
MSDMRILVVDDNKDFADVLCDILKSNQYIADSCYGGKHAIELVTASKFDIVFLDISMPEMNGVEALKEIKKVRPDSMVVMMTGFPMDELAHKAIEEKAADIIYKPFEIDKILNLIKNSTKQ